MLTMAVDTPIGQVTVRLMRATFLSESTMADEDKECLLTAAGAVKRWSLLEEGEDGEEEEKAVASRIALKMCCEAVNLDKSIVSPVDELIRPMKR